MKAFYNSWNNFYKSPFGAIPTCNYVTFKIKLTEKVKKIFLVTCNGHELQEYTMEYIDTKNNLYIYKLYLKMPKNPTVIFYYFKIISNEELYLCPNDLHGGEGKVFNSITNMYQITVYNIKYSVPKWFKNAVFYQIFVDRFYTEDEKKEIIDKDIFIKKTWGQIPYYIRDEQGKVTKYDVFGGDLRGIIKKLSYIKSLGVTGIYLNPIFKAYSNHKYDTADYEVIDEGYGNEEVFKELCVKAKELGINIVVDGVFNHTGSDSKYFNKSGRFGSSGAYRSKQSKYYNWYNFYEYPNKYECWWGIDTLPRIKSDNKDYKNYIFNDKDSITTKWFSNGILGWRLDVVDELSDEFVMELKDKVKKIDKNSILIGEVWEDASNKISYGIRKKYLLGSELDSVMNYPLREYIINFFIGKIHSDALNNDIMSLYENYPLEYFYSTLNILGTHDVPRILTILGAEVQENSLNEEERKNFRLSNEFRKKAVKIAKMAFLFQFTFPGVPCIYYGDEVGMEGFSDPYNRETYPWGKEDTQLLNWIKKISCIRNENDCLKTGEFIPVYYNNDVYGYIRKISNNKDVFGDEQDNSFFIVLFNRANICHTISIDLHKYNIKTLINVFNKESVELISKKLVITIPAFESILLRGII